ncbi:MAG: nuclear transport factor 2 family protein [Phycisphaerae bacterium]
MKCYLHALSLLALASLLVSAAPVPTAAPTPLEQSINQLHAELRAAAERLDADALYSHVVDSNAGPIIEDGRLYPTRQEALASTRQGFARLASVSYTYDHKYVTQLSPTTVLWVADGSSSATLPDGRQITAPFAETIVFTLQDNQWKVLHAHRSTPNARP